MEKLTCNLTSQQITETAIITFIGAMLLGIAANHPQAGDVTKSLAALLQSFAVYSASLSIYMSYQTSKKK